MEPGVMKYSRTVVCKNLFGLYVQIE